MTSNTIHRKAAWRERKGTSDIEFFLYENLQVELTMQDNVIYNPLSINGKELLGNTIWMI
jgi:hypothetical protein